MSPALERSQSTPSALPSLLNAGEGLDPEKAFDVVRSLYSDRGVFSLLSHPPQFPLDVQLGPRERLRVRFPVRPLRKGVLLVRGIAFVLSGQAPGQRLFTEEAGPIDQLAVEVTGTIPPPYTSPLAPPPPLAPL